MKVGPSATVQLLHLGPPLRPATVRAINFPEMELSLVFFFNIWLSFMKCCITDALDAQMMISRRMVLISTFQIEKAT
jgi:hypothetical protein